ncbi:MAG: hypothetical protein CMD33_03635 [Flavobacteriales bacterium]|nr:hypothetical protein [Flavobacteriales bacterium]
MSSSGPIYSDPDGPFGEIIKLVDNPVIRLGEGGYNTIFDIVGTGTVLRIASRGINDRAEAMKVAIEETKLAEEAGEYAVGVIRFGVLEFKDRVFGDDLYKSWQIIPKAKGDLHRLLFKEEVSKTVKRVALERSIGALRGMLYEKGFLYTDTKPANFLYTIASERLALPEVKVGDFDETFTVRFARNTPEPGSPQTFRTQKVKDRMKKNSEGIWSSVTAADKEVFFISQAVQMLGQVLVNGMIIEDPELIEATREAADVICKSKALPRFFDILRKYKSGDYVPQTQMEEHLIAGVMRTFNHYFEFKRRDFDPESPFMEFMCKIITSLCSEKEGIWGKLGMSNASDIEGVLSTSGLSKPRCRIS